MIIEAEEKKDADGDKIRRDNMEPIDEMKKAETKIVDGNWVRLTKSSLALWYRSRSADIYSCIVSVAILPRRPWRAPRTA